MTLVSFPKVIVPSLLGACLVSYAFFDLARNRKIFGGNGSTLSSALCERDDVLGCVGRLGFWETVFGDSLVRLVRVSGMCVARW